MSGVQTIEHGRYVIRAGLLSGKPTARAFLQNAQGAGIIEEATGKTVDEATAACIAQLDARDADAEQARGETPEGWTIATEEEFRLAWMVLQGDLSDNQKAMLLAHAAAGDEGLTATELAQVADYKSHASANLHYGKVGAMFADYLGLPLPPSETRIDEPVATGILAAPGTPRDSGEFVWVMHTALRRALDAAA